MTETTTIEIYADDADWWAMCKRAKKMNSAACFHAFRDAVRCQKQADFYATLAMPSDYKKPLVGVKIDKQGIEK